MKKIFSILIIVVLCFSLTACVETYDDIKDYSIIYDNVHNANKTFTKEGQKETLLCWGEYTYCSYLLLFPRKTPDDLCEFHYYWCQSMDYDDYGIYFTYKLDDKEYQDFKTKISEFKITYGDQINKPIFTEDLFDYPTYIMQWSNEVETGGFCEYIMLDDESCTVINVFKMFYYMQEMQDIAEYNILPKNNDYNAVQSLMPDETIRFAKHHGFSVYAFKNEENKLFVPSVEDITYNSTFIENK